MSSRKIILLIRDGWGYREDEYRNAIKEANTPINDKLKTKYPNKLISASGRAVGLPQNFQGNSEVGHLTLGSGRVIDQDMTRINKSIENGSFYEKFELVQAIKSAKEKNGNLHLMGLMQKEGIHSSLDHLYALLELCRKHDFEDVYIHIFTDGRDAPVTKGKQYMKELLEKLEDIGLGKIATISGRYYAMDRDERWDRTEKAYRAIVEAKAGESFDKPLKLLKRCYANDETDEFIVPRVRKDYQGMNNEDSAIFYNFRTDRPRQLTKAIVEKDFDKFDRDKIDPYFVTMTKYYEPMNAKVAFKDKNIEQLLGKMISEEELSQLRISETEKYAHVTFFFNGQREEPYENEDRIIIPSPGVEYYNNSPKMKAKEISDKLVERIKEDDYEFIVVNLVNCDMVGHTGKKKAIIEAVEAVDNAQGKIIDAGLEEDYTILVTADHGNAEDQTDDWRTSHTINPVEFIVVSDDDDLQEIKLREDGGLKDIAPTILSLMDIDKSDKMTGQNLIKS